MREFASSAIGLNRTFSGLQPLLFRTKLLAFNAEIASARIGESGVAFGVVVKDLISMGQMLRSEVDGLETIFHEVARHVGVWIRSRTRFRMYLNVVDHFNADASEPAEPLRDLFVLSNRVNHAYAEQKGKRESLPALERTWTLALQCRNDAIRNLLAVETYCRKLGRFLERMNYVATQQSGFLATTARVEATHASQDVFDLGDVANDIHILANDFSALQRRANDAVRALTSEADRIADLVNRK